MSEPEHAPHAGSAEASGPDAIEEYAGGEIKVRHGIVNRWLLVIYLALLLWSLYYVFTYWGGLGPGLAY